MADNPSTIPAVRVVTTAFVIATMLLSATAFGAYKGERVAPGRSALYVVERDISLTLYDEAGNELLATGEPAVYDNCVSLDYECGQTITGTGHAVKKVTFHYRAAEAFDVEIRLVRIPSKEVLAATQFLASKQVVGGEPQPVTVEFGEAVTLEDGADYALMFHAQGPRQQKVVGFLGLGNLGNSTYEGGGQIQFIVYPPDPPPAPALFPELPTDEAVRKAVCAEMVAQALRDAPGKEANAVAVEEVISGKRTVANAAWWGFDEQDSTQALQSAIRSGARTLLIPDMGKPWLARPLELAGNQQILFEPGTVVMAKAGEFHGEGEHLFVGRDIANVSLIGYWATIAMRKADYQSSAYAKSEHRHAFGFRAVQNLQIAGLTIRESGGDGVYLANGADQQFCRNVRVYECLFDAHHRQGMSIISAENLLVENCTFTNTSGTAPSEGIDMEPDNPFERLVNVHVRTCTFENNAGGEVTIHVGNLEKSDIPVSVLVEGCHVKGSPTGHGLRVIAFLPDGPPGMVEFKDCLVENTSGPGIFVLSKSATSTRTRFTNVTLRNTATWWDGTAEGDRGVNVQEYGWAGRRIWPVYIYNGNPPAIGPQGGVEFVDCTIEDDRDRPFLFIEENGTQLGARDIQGWFFVKNPHGGRMELGMNNEGVEIETAAK